MSASPFAWSVYTLAVYVSHCNTPGGVERLSWSNERLNVLTPGGAKGFVMVLGARLHSGTFQLQPAAKPKAVLTASCPVSEWHTLRFRKPNLIQSLLYRHPGYHAGLDPALAASPPWLEGKGATPRKACERLDMGAGDTRVRVEVDGRTVLLCDPDYSNRRLRRD